MGYRIVCAALWLALPAMAAGQTRVEVNHAKNFTQYKTFAVEVEPPVRADGSVDEHNTIILNRQRQAVAYQLRMRGLSETDVDPDLTVRVSSRETEYTELVGSGFAYGPYGAYGPYYGPWGYGGYWGGYGYWGGNAYPYTYYKGDLKVDVFERSSGDLVYRGISTRDVDEDDLAEDAMKFARKAFKKFPIAMPDDD
jgi:hypothetical protein